VRSKIVLSVDQANEYEKWAEDRLKRSNEAADPEEQWSWLALAPAWLKLAAADRDIPRKAA
jgi:hypothetical protein